MIGEQESSVSDWKEKFDGSPDSRRELARDVASFGNAQGGLLVIGLAEGANSAAFEFVGWNDDNLGDLADWVTSVVRGNVSPPLRFSAHCLVGPGEKPVVLVAIDASDRAPHAVDVGSKLQYPVRDGRSKRYLSEAEVADWYGRRLQRAGQRELDLDRLTEEGAGVAEPEVPTVLMGLAPMRPGLGRVLPGDLERYQEGASNPIELSRWVGLGTGTWMCNTAQSERRTAREPRPRTSQLYELMAADGAPSSLKPLNRTA